MLYDSETRDYKLSNGYGVWGSLLERKYPNEPLKMRSVFNLVPDFEPHCVFYHFGGNLDFLLLRTC